MSESAKPPGIPTQHLGQYVLRLMRMRDFLHLVLSYPMRIGYEEYLKQLIDEIHLLLEMELHRYADDDPNFCSLRTRIESLSEKTLEYVQVIIPNDIIKGIIFGGGDITKPTPPVQILFLASDLALHQLTLTLTSDDKIQNIWFSDRNYSEKKYVVKGIWANSHLHEAFDNLQIIGLNQIDYETKRELGISAESLKKDDYALVAKNYGRGRHLVLVVDGYGGNKVDPQKETLPIQGDSQHVVVFITTRSLNDDLSNRVDLTIQTGDHFLPWELFCRTVGWEIIDSSTAIERIAAKIVAKFGGHLLAIILMAKSLKGVEDVQTWQLALENVPWGNRNLIVNAFFNVIWPKVISDKEKVRRIRYLLVFKFQDWKMSDDQLFARWFSEQLVDTEEEAESILQTFMECSVLLKFEDTLGRYIILPEDIRIILHAVGEEIPENLSEGAAASTISDHFLKFSSTLMRKLYAVNTQPPVKELNLEGHMMKILELSPQIAKLENLQELRLDRCQRLKTLPQEIWELQKLETLSLEFCSQLLELPPAIAKLENLKELRLDWCKRLETLPEEIWELQKLETLSLQGLQLQELPPQIAKLENLKELRLDWCKRLETLPQEIWELQKLETLSLQGLQMQELPPQIAKLENLKELRLDRCERLLILPQEIWELQKLEILSLKFCSQLLELPPAIAKLENLKELRLDGCQRLEILPQEILDLPNLQTLRLVSPSIFPRSKNQEWINSDYLPHSSSGYHKNSGRRKKAIPSSSTAITPIGYTLKLKVDGGFEQFERLSQKIMLLQIPNIEMCDLSNIESSHLPRIINFPNLTRLLLGNNLNLMKIPSSFFDHVPLLSILDLSRTSIHELPRSIFNLQELRELYLQDCELFVELPPDISRLMNLTTLDLDGTLITHLPKEIQWLTNLESLSLSFYDDSSSEVIPPDVLYELTKLKFLRIDVNSDSDWWLKNIERILEEINGLWSLQELEMYIPRVNLLNSLKRSLTDFRFIVGHHKPRMISRVPPAIEVIFKESSPSLKFVNREDFPYEVKSILFEARAFFLDRHMGIKNLAQIGLENLKWLRLCILAECNEMQSIVDMDEYGAELGPNESLCMQFLTIFFMKNLRSIINKPSNSIFRELKLLALHTCPELTTIFPMHSLHGLVNLEELIVEDCPKLSSIITCPSSERTTDFFLPRLRKVSLLFVPELESISDGVCIGRNLEQIGLYYCPKLQSLSTAELSSKELKVIRGETEWWEALQWSEAEWGQQDPHHKFKQIFSPIDENLDIFTQLTTYDELPSFNRENDSGITRGPKFFGEEIDSVIARAHLDPGFTRGLKFFRGRK